MNLLYKPKDQQTLRCEVVFLNGKIAIDFYLDCGKHGTDEMLQGYVLTPERLMQILSERDDITDDEL
jgi:hypothetical protein